MAIEVPPVRGSSYVTIAYSRVRGLILSGELAPGSRVTVRPLADLLDLSPTPIRTALAALERQGLLEIREHRGYFVPKLGREDMLEIYEIREAVDSIASRRVAQSESRADVVTALEALLEQQRSCVAEGDIDAYGDLDVTFHKTIWRSSGNRRLVSVSDTLLGQVRIGNNISARAPGRVQTALAEHSGIIEAIRQGDAEAAERATREHVRRASIALGKLLAIKEAEDNPTA
ncbi:GntR family transcriptional regulator [Arthrobacter pigmenti]